MNQQEVFIFISHDEKYLSIFYTDMYFYTYILYTLYIYSR